MIAAAIGMNPLRGGAVKKVRQKVVMQHGIFSCNVRMIKNNHVRRRQQRQQRRSLGLALRVVRQDERIDAVSNVNRQQMTRMMIYLHF